MTGSYDFSKVGVNGLVLGALYQQAEPTDKIVGLEGLEEKAWLLSSTYKVGNTPWVVKAQYQTAEHSDALMVISPLTNMVSVLTTTSINKLVSTVFLHNKNLILLV